MKAYKRSTFYSLVVQDTIYENLDTTTKTSHLDSYIAAILALHL